MLVVDTEMPGPAVTELVRLVGQADPATRVLLLAEDAAPTHPGRPAGMTRAASARELAEAIRAVAAGFRVVMADPMAAPEREGSRAGGVPGAAHSPERPERDDHAELLLRSLSERERQVLDLLARGYSNRRIAEVLLPVAQHRPHPRAERAGQAGRTLQAGGGRTGRAPGAGASRT